MEETKKDICSGKVKMFNGVYGFLDYSDGDIFFHKSAICENSNLIIGDSVSFIIAPSSKKNGQFQAENISTNKNSSTSGQKDIETLKTDSRIKYDKLKSNKRPIAFLIGSIKWYSDQNEYGVILANDSEYFFRKKDINNFIKYNYNEGDICIFLAGSSSFKETGSTVFRIGKSDYPDFKPIISNHDLLAIEIEKKLDQLKEIKNKYILNQALQLIDVLKLLEYNSIEIIDKFYEKCSSEYRFYLWYYNYTSIFELEYSIDLVCHENIHYNKLILDETPYDNFYSSYQSYFLLER